MKTSWQTITLHRNAPPKPRPGEPCNGCGVCCAAEPCPIAALFLFQRRGRCRALVWQDEHARYVCGMVTSPESHSRLIPASLGKLMGGFFASRISAGAGCDSTAELDVEEA